MFESLDDVDWGALRTARGDASGIPDLIRNLTSPALRDRVRAVLGLYEHLCHRSGRVHEATPVAVPFLVELLESPDVPTRPRILEFLADVARAVPLVLWADEPVPTPPTSEESEWLQAARAAVWRGFDTYLELLDDDEEAVRVSAPYTLGLLASHAGEAVPVGIPTPFARAGRALAARLGRESSPLVRASLARGLAALAEHHPEHASVVRDLLEDEAFPVRLAAALGIVDLDPEGVPDAAVALLVEALGDVERTDRAFVSEEPPREWRHHPYVEARAARGEPLVEPAGPFDDVGAWADVLFPWPRKPDRFEVVEATCRIPRRFRPRVLPVWLDRIRAAEGSTLDGTVVPILAAVFADSPVSDATGPGDLDAGAEGVLRAVFGNPRLWATMADIRSAFERIGLDDDRARWRRLLGLPPGEEVPPEVAARILDRIAFDEPDIRCVGEHVPRDRESVREIVLRRIATDAHLPLLGEFTGLRRLDLCDSEVTPAGLRRLPILPHLENLQLAGLRLDQPALWRFSELSSLGTLNLSWTDLDDDGLAILRSLRELRTLWLSGTGVTDAAIDVLVRFPALREVDLSTTAVTESGRSRLEAARPGIRIV